MSKKLAGKVALLRANHCSSQAAMPNILKLFQ